MVVKAKDFRSRDIKQIEENIHISWYYRCLFIYTRKPEGYKKYV